MRNVLSVLGTLAFLYVLLGVLAALTYKRLLYPAPTERPFAVPSRAVLVSRATPLGTPFHAVYFAARGEAPTLLLFHGNGETVVSSLPRANDLADHGLGVLLAEYRGYGLSAASGTPSEEGLYDDGAAALAFLEEQHVPKNRIVAWGTSLGTGVAAELASRGQVGRLVLATPFTSIRELAARLAWFLPTSWIVREQFDTLAKAPRIRVPTLVVHGDHDEVVPYDMGQEVAGAIAGASFIRVPGGHHNDLFARDASLFGRVVAFVGGVP